MGAEEVINFWFNEIEPSSWWSKNKGFDQLITDKFLHLHLSANRCELYDWRDTPIGRLAEILVLDQFSRNMYRGQAAAFASDSLALALAQEAIARGIDEALTAVQRSFLYMPFMHSESAAIHSRAVSLFEANGIESNFKFELRHKSIIDQFGRYPHRNDILGRASTAAEIEFLRQPGSSF